MEVKNILQVQIYLVYERILFASNLKSDFMKNTNFLCLYAGFFSHISHLFFIFRHLISEKGLTNPEFMDQSRKNILKQ